jgi:hypothetical protein
VLFAEIFIAGIAENRQEIDRQAASTLLSDIKRHFLFGHEHHRKLFIRTKFHGMAYMLRPRKRFSAVRLHLLNVSGNISALWRKLNVNWTGNGQSSSKAKRNS